MCLIGQEVNLENYVVKSRFIDLTYPILSN